ncbi:MAG TPA: hypothetical protein VLR89_00630 [Anaerolineaceae bacterium]|nr:hypothetical protein [Anaerolineaceae bacterium]
MNSQLMDGARVIVGSWLKLRKNEKLLILFDQKYQDEADALVECALEAEAFPTLQGLEEIVADPSRRATFGDLLMQFDVAVGASDFSLITTRHVIKATRTGTRFLSLPLVTLNGQSMLTYDFIREDPYQTRAMAECLIPIFEANDTIHVISEAGTDIWFRYANRKTSALYGLADEPGKIASASFEIYIPIEEDQTHGRLVLDGSMGQIGLVNEPVTIEYQQGHMTEIQDNAEGRRLEAYINKFNDERMRVTAEFGLGLNKLSQLVGNCYIEDESAYGTFHIGHGRNLSLGGQQDAAGHFDLVMRSPTIFVGDVEIMHRGELLLCHQDWEKDVDK